MAQASWARLAERIAREVGDYHRTYPLRAGMPREALRSRLALESRLFQIVLARAAEEGLLVDEGAVVRLPDHVIRFSPEQQAAVDALFAQIAANPVNTPSVKEAAALVGEEVLQVLIERGDVVQVSGEVLFDSATYRHLVAEVERYIEQHGSISVAQARDAFGTSRKYALALLEHLDSIGVTRRVGDERVLRRGSVSPRADQ